MATDKQLDFIQKLVRERNANITYDAQTLTVQDASKLIGELLAIKPPEAPEAEPLTHGMYMTPEGVIYKLQLAVHGSGRLYGKRLTLENLGTDSNPEYKVRFVYEPGVLKRVTIEDRMTLEQARAFGALYGTCCVCGRTLTDEVSIAAGIGPICAGRL